MMIVTVVPKDRASRVIEFQQDQVAIGRLPDSDLLLPERDVSKRHARIGRDGDGDLYLEDLGSRNGTWMAGRRISGRVTIRPGDEFIIADYRLSVHLERVRKAARTDPGLNSPFGPAGTVGSSSSFSSEGLIRWPDTGGQPLLSSETPPRGTADGASSTHQRLPAVGVGASVPGAAVELAPGRQLRDWIVGDPLGRGGMAQVFRVTHRLTGQARALKVLLPELTRDSTARRFFLREADIMTRLRHPNLVWAESPFEEDGLLCVVMEILSGRSMVDEMLSRPPPWPLAESLDIVLAMTSGLAHAHARKIVHRDIKPSNVLLSSVPGEEPVRVIDFGIACPEGEKPGEDGSTLVGTPLFLPPEALDRAVLPSPRQDVYALGMLLFFMVAGRPAIDMPPASAPVWQQMAAVLRAHEAGLPVLSEYAKVPRGLTRLIGRCLSRDPRSRPADAGQLVRDLMPLAAASRSPTMARVRLNAESSATTRG